MRIACGLTGRGVLSRLFCNAAVIAGALMLICMGSCRHSAGRESCRSVDSAALADSLASIRMAADMTNAAETYADSVLAGLSLRERVGMLFLPAVFSRGDAVTLRQISEYADSLKVGGIVLLKGDLHGAAVIADTLRRRRGPGLFVAVDAENGLRMRFADAPEFPWNRELGYLSDDQLLYEFGREIARECRAIGINMLLGPVIDVVPGEGSHGIMRKRSLGSDPRRVADLAVAYARGLEEGNVLSVAKHFPGHGSASADSHRALGEIRAGREEIDSVDLYPFRRYVAEGLSGVMVGHLSVRALDSVRRPAVVSPVVMQDILRDRLGFEGLVITDALNMEGAMGVKGWQAIDAGADMIIAPSDTRGEISAMLRALGEGRLSRATVDDRCRRILFYKYLMGLDKQEHISDIAAAVEEVSAGAPAVRDSITYALRRHMNRTPRH